MARIRPVVEREHPAAKLRGVLNAEGTQRLYAFKNGYGASVVRYKYYRPRQGWFGSAGGLSDLWELAILKFSRANPDPINEGVIHRSAVLGFQIESWLTDVAYHQILDRIRRLPSHLRSLND